MCFSLSLSQAKTNFFSLLAAAVATRILTSIYHIFNDQIFLCFTPNPPLTQLAGLQQHVVVHTVCANEFTQCQPPEM